METNNQIVADSNFFIALYNSNDSLHSAALKEAEIIYKQNITLIISNLIFLEVVTVLSQRVGKAVALRVGRYLLEDPFVKIVHIDALLQTKTWELFRQVSQKNVSFVDCSIIVIMQAEALSKLLTFDSLDFKALRKFYKFQTVN